MKNRYSVPINSSVTGSLDIYEILNNFYYIEGSITLIKNGNGLDANSILSIAKITKCIPSHNQSIYCSNLSGGKYYSGYLVISNDGNISIVNSGNVATYFYTNISSFYKK